MKNKPSEPVRMSYPNYAYLRGLLDYAEEEIKNDYQQALFFIPSEPFNPKRKSGLDKAHKILTEELTKIRKVRDELHAAVQAAYKDHPNPEMRQFWGIEE